MWARPSNRIQMPRPISPRTISLVAKGPTLCTWTKFQAEEASLRMTSIRTRGTSTVLWLWEISVPMVKMWRANLDSRHKLEHHSRIKGSLPWIYPIKARPIWWTKVWCRSDLVVWIRVGTELASASAPLKTAAAFSTDPSQLLRSARLMPLKIVTIS